METRQLMKDFYESLHGEWQHVKASARVLGREIGEYSMKYHNFGFSMSNDGTDIDGSFDNDIMSHLNDGFMGDIVSFWILSLEIILNDGSIVTFKEAEPDLPGSIIVVPHSTELDLWHIKLPIGDGKILVLKHYKHGKVHCYVMNEDQDFDDCFNGWTIHLRCGSWIHDTVVKGHSAVFDADINHRQVIVFFNDKIFKLKLEDHYDVDDRTIRCD